MPDPSLRPGHRALVAVFAVDAQPPVFDAPTSRRRFGRGGNGSRSRRGSEDLEQLAKQNGAFRSAARAACLLVTARRAKVSVRPGGRGALGNVRGGPRRIRSSRLLRHGRVSLAPPVGQLTGPSAGSRDPPDGVKGWPQAGRNLPTGKSHAVRPAGGRRRGDTSARSLYIRTSACRGFGRLGPETQKGLRTNHRPAGEFRAAGERIPGRSRPWIGVSPWLS